MVSLSSVGVLVLFCIGICHGQRKGSRNIPVGADLKQAVNFDCPEEFGYYPHPSDCTQYYVCVFGGALLESCTGGLMYSHELQTCDWPRNVGCDGLEISAPPSSAAVSTTSARGRDRDRERERDRDEPRARYSPPPPPQPAAVVTSRGQSRQLHHTQQEIIKQQQQQQLYADAEETLPPAEEIESDRQQRVYRGQPSTVGQVQRDRDGLRHSNAIPSYTGRGEKIGVISFGTQNQHYSKVTDDDDLLTNDLTIKRRRKRQAKRSRLEEEEMRWRTHRDRIARIKLSSSSPSPVPKQNQKDVFKPSQLQTDSSNDFKPFVPSYKLNPQTRNSTTNTNYEKKQLATSSSNRDNNYSYLTIGKPERGLQPAFTNVVTKKESVRELKPPNNTTRTVSTRKHHTEVVTKPYPKIETSTAESVRSDKGGAKKPKEDGKETDEKSEEESSSFHDEEDDEEHFNPPPEFFRTESRYENIRNPFADPDFDFDKFLDRLRGPTRKPPKVKIIPKSQQGVARLPDKSPSDPVAGVTQVPLPFTPNGVINPPELNQTPPQYQDPKGNPNAYTNNVNRAIQPLPQFQQLQPLPQLQQLPPLTQLQTLPQLPQYQSLQPLPQLQSLPQLQYRPLPQINPLNTPQQLKTMQFLQSAAIINEYIDKNAPKTQPLPAKPDANANAKPRLPLSFVNIQTLQKPNNINKYYEQKAPQAVQVPNDLDKTSSIQSRPIVNVYYEKNINKAVLPAIRETSSVRPSPASTASPQVIIERHQTTAKPPPKEYYYEYQDATSSPKKLYSSQIKTTIKKANKVVVKKPTVEYEYYYDDYDDEFPDKNKKNQPKNNGNKQSIQPTLRANNTAGGEVKYSARYQEKPSGPVTNIPRPSPTSQNVDTFNTHSVYNSQLPNTTPKSLLSTARLRKKPSTRPVVSTATATTTTKPPRGKPKQRLPTRFDLDIKREQVAKSDESSVAPAQPSIATATATARNLYNSSQYTSNHYDPYYALYDDDVELYRDVDYSQHNYNNAPRAQTTSYRGTPAPVVQSTSTREEPPKRGNSVYLNNYSQDIYQQSTGADYADDNRYDAQVDDQTSYRQSSRQPTSLRGDRNELNDVEEAITKRTTTSTTTRKTTTTTRTTTTTTTPRTIPPKKSTPPPPARTSSRGRGTAHYASNGAQITNNEVTVNTNRGTPAPRSRPTLKPSTSIVSKAQEFVDIYKYPPRRPDPIYPQPQPDKTAAKCRKDVCLLPDCSCGGKEIPGDLPVEQVPQIVLLTFDDSVNDLNKGLYMDLFEKGRTNPNGCPIAATFYVSHEWTDYSQVQNLYSDGHEIASHTVSHSFGEQFSQKKWTREVAGQREILSAYGGVHLEDVRGMRAPFLSVGGNKMFKMLYDSNFTYDSSMPIYENKPPSWPYTLDYKLFHDCMIPPCPTRSYPGVWEVPMVMWQDLNGGRCSMGDACSNPPDAEGVFKMLTKNFQRHYTTNRAPFGLFYHAAWFTQPHHKEGFINFIDSILAMKDVWLLTNWQAIQWVRDPTPVSRIGSFQPFQCEYSNRPKRCNNPKVCNLWHKSGVRYMRTCQPCPDIYPWTGNTGIRSSRIDNDIED